jgi:phosphatidylinositol-3-phosphatase
VRHVFVVNLENENYADTFGPSSPAVYLNKTLVPKGQLLDNYYGTAHNSLPNYIAQLSGQGPNPQTQGDCQIYSDFHIATTTSDGQAVGAGCVYPASVKTLADQLSARHFTWKGYMEDIGNSPTEPKTCRHPAIDTQDDTQQAKTGDEYAARHNPFVYFHSIIDSPACAKNVVGLDQLGRDLRATSTTPNVSYITPNLCDDGHDSPCQGPGAEGANPGAGGLTSANAFLAKLVPEIQASKAYQRGGLIVITFDEGESDKGCCGESEYSTGGGQIGAVLLGTHLHPHTSTCEYNHFSLLRTWEDLFHLGVKRTGMFGSDRFGHLAHAGDTGLVSLKRELVATSDPCAAA